MITYSLSGKYNILSKLLVLTWRHVLSVLLDMTFVAGPFHWFLAVLICAAHSTMVWLSQELAAKSLKLDLSVFSGF